MEETLPSITSIFYATRSYMNMLYTLNPIPESLSLNAQLKPSQVQEPNTACRECKQSLT